MKAERAAARALRAEAFAERAYQDLEAAMARLKKWQRRIRYYRAAEARALKALNEKMAATGRHLELED